MAPFYTGLITGVGFTTGLFGFGFLLTYLLRKTPQTPIITETGTLTGGPAFIKRTAKLTPKAPTELHEYNREKEEEGKNRGR